MHLLVAVQPAWPALDDTDNLVAAHSRRPDRRRRCSRRRRVRCRRPSARAQFAAPIETTVDAQLFQPAIGPRNFLTVDSTSVLEHKRLGFGLSVNYQRHPYQVYTQGAMPGTSNLIDYQWTSELNAAIGLFGKYQAGISIPFTLYLAGDEIDAMGMPRNFRLTESGIGDVRVEGKALLATLGEEEEYTVGLVAGLSLPTGKSDSRPYLGDKNVTGRIKGIFQAELGPVRAAANLGLLFRGTSQSFKTEVGHQLLYGVGRRLPCRQARRPHRRGVRAQRAE